MKNYIKVFISKLLANLLNQRNIDIILRYSYLIIILIAVLLILRANLTKRVKRIKVRKTREKRFKKISEIKLIQTPISKISEAFSFTNSLSKEANDLIGILIILLYIVLVALIYKYLNTFAFLWYTKSVNLIMAVFLPFAMIHTYISIQINIVIKQIPDALSEILSAYRTEKRIKVAIEEATQYMGRNIKREFKRINVYLNSEATFEYGLDYFSNRLRYGYITLFCTLIKESRYKSSDITEALEKLVYKTRSKNYMKEKAKRQLVWYRVFLIACLFAIPAIMKFVAKASLDAYRYYNTVEGAKLLTMTMVSIIVGYLLIMFMEKN